MLPPAGSLAGWTGGEGGGTGTAVPSIGGGAAMELMAVPERQAAGSTVTGSGCSSSLKKSQNRVFCIYLIHHLCSRGASSINTAQLSKIHFY